VLIGIQMYDSDRVTMQRQQRAAEALLQLKGVECLNLQFREGPSMTFPGIETAAVLCRDSLSVTHAACPRKPLAREVFDVLADRALAGGHEYFGFINADIVVTSAAIDEIERRRRQTYVISRCEVDDLTNADPNPGRPMTTGLDMFVVSARWWPRHRGRFRQYIVGEGCWDNVYAAILMCHSDGLLLNREVLILHERHPSAWHKATPSAHYNGFLAALDARYFSLWVRYWHRLEQARAGGESAADEEDLQHEVFAWRRSANEAVRQAVRSARARLLYHRFRSEGRRVASSRG
jgi:hypothetical protein